MKKFKFCNFCQKKLNYERHITILALLHLEIEHYPRADFETFETFEKASVLKRSVSAKNIHLNLAYATTQLINLEKSSTLNVKQN